MAGEALVLLLPRMKKATSTHLTRAMAPDLGIFNLSDSGPDFIHSEEIKLLMEYTFQIHGSVIQNGEERLSEAAEKNQMELMKLAYCVAVEKFSMSQPAGIIFWSGRKHTPSVHLGGNGVAVIWTQFNKRSYLVRKLDSSQTFSVNKITGEKSWNSKCGFLLYSFIKKSEDPDETLQKTATWKEDDLKPRVLPETRVEVHGRDPQVFP